MISRDHWFCLSMSIEEMPFLIEKLIEAIGEAHRRLSTTHGRPVSFDDVQFALEEVFGVVDQPGLLPLRRLTADQIVEQLTAFPFSKFHPEVVAVVELEESIIPADTPISLREKIVKSGGELWEIHKNDADPFPSNPHAHSYDAGLSLNLKTGRLYDKRKLVGKAKKKQVRDILGKAKIDLSLVTSHPDSE